jgi:hypothetical protein
MMSITMRADNANSGLGKLLHTRRKVPRTPEWKAANEQIERLDRQKKRRVPDERHKQRMSALYVDAVSIDRWNRPAKEIARKSAREFLIDAVNDYSVQYSQGYTDLEIMIKQDDPELYRALSQWSDRPQLPRPERLYEDPPDSE